ncbi:MAG TPA: serine protease, partial [Pirellulaceae bacterium]|nr:serine protease [Pirellulaceae bacterium]
HALLASRSNDWVEGSRATGLAVPQGGRWTVTMNWPRGQGTTYSGPFDVVAEGLPEGVKLVAPRVPANATRWPLQLEAAPNVKPGGAIVRFHAKAVDPAVQLVGGCQQAIPFVNHSGGDAWQTLRVDRFAMAVTDEAPIAIDLVQPTTALVRGGELFIPVELKRRAGFEEAIEFQADFAPPGVSLPPKEAIEAGANSAVLRITAERNAPLGKGPLYIMATTLGANDYLGAGRIRVSSKIVEIEVTEPFVELASEPASVRRGGRAIVSFAVTPKSPFEGEAEVKLLGLPKGVNLVGPSPRITKDAKRITFEIEATDEALLGPAGEVECELIVKAAGQEIRQRAGKGRLRIDPRL